MEELMIHEMVDKLEAEFPKHKFSFTTYDGGLTYLCQIDGHRKGLMTRELIHSEDFFDEIEEILADGNFQPHK
jgi:hypothetical protein